jgi:Ca2+-binding RTX toxin-like protein
MAQFYAIEAFDVSKFDFNWYSRNYFDETLLRGRDERIDGTLYRDFLVLNGFNTGANFYDDFYLTFAGNGIRGSIDRGTISGTVTLMAEVSADTAGDFYNWWGMSGISVPARAILNAGKTASLSDDRALFASALKGNDRIELSDFDDRMYGFAGRDTIYGNAGDDTIEGGKGKDQLYGGADSDTFVFDDGDSGRGAGTSGRDVIFDFASGEDVLNLQAIDANTRQRGDQSFSLSDGAARNAIWLSNSGSATIVSGDTNGDGRADFEIELRGATGLSAGDFIL